MGGAVQSSLKRWVPLGQDDSSSRDPGIFLFRLVESKEKQLSSREIAELYCQPKDYPLYEGLPEDLLAYSQLLHLIKAGEDLIDSHEVLALVHKLNSPEKLMKLILAYCMKTPLDMVLIASCKHDHLCQFIEEMLYCRCTLLEFLVKVVETVQQASGGASNFPRWSYSTSFLTRAQFALSSLGLLKYINSARTAAGTSLFVEFLYSPEFTGLEGEFEDMMVLLMVQFGFWLEAKKLYELALMWLDSFNLNVLTTTSPVSVDLLACLVYLRGVLAAALERPEAFSCLLEVSLHFPVIEPSSPLRKFIASDEPWDRLVFLKHCVDVSAGHRQLSLVRDFCAEILLLLKEDGDLSLDGLDISGQNSNLQFSLEVFLRYFNVLLELDNPESAFMAISMVPNVFDKPRECVIRLVEFIVSRPEHRLLLTQLPWGAWWPDVETLLEEWELYRILYAAYISRSDFKSASSALYRLARKTVGFEEARLLTILAKQTLLLCEDSWILFEDRIIDAIELDKDIVLLEAKQFVSERDPEASLDLESLQNHMFSYGAYKLAFKLAEAFRCSSDPIFSELAQELVYHQQTLERAQADSLQWVDLWLEGTECVQIDPVAAIGKVIRGCLEKNRSSYQYGLVAQSIFENGGTLPEWLKVDLMLLDNARLVRLLTKFGLLDEAFKCAQEAIKSEKTCMTAGSVQSLLSQLTLQHQRDELERSWREYLDAGLTA